MTNEFFDRPIFNSPYAYPARHWELDSEGQPTNKTLDARRPLTAPRPEDAHPAQRAVAIVEARERAGVAASAR